MATEHKDEWMDNPVFAGHGPTLPSTFSEPPARPKKPKPPAAIGRIIGELGLRYRPSAQADLEAHAESIRLLTEDLADVPAYLLETAAKRWVRESRFMPKASELVALARGQISEVAKGSDYGLQQLQNHCDRLNDIDGGRTGWRVIGIAPNRTIATARDVVSAA